MGKPCPNHCDDGTVYVDCQRCLGTGEELVSDPEEGEKLITCRNPECNWGIVPRTCSRCKGKGEV